jgi:hypothetical protein
VVFAISDTKQGHIVWRTSTPEPTSGAGIIWQYLKDVTRFLPLFSKPGTFILQFDNLIETGLNGEYASAYCICWRNDALILRSI